MYTKPGTDATLLAAGGRVLRTIAQPDGSYSLEYQAVDSNEQMHPSSPPAKFTNEQVVAWFTNAVNNPGSVPKVDAILAAHPGLNISMMVGARKVLFAYGDIVALGFTDT